MKKKLRNNSCGYKLKDYFKRFFLSYIEKILSYLVKLKYLNQKGFFIPRWKNTTLKQILTIRSCNNISDLKKHEPFKKLSNTWMKT